MGEIMRAHGIKKYTKAFVQSIPFFFLSFVIMGIIGAIIALVIGRIDRILDMAWAMQYIFGFPSVIGGFYVLVGAENSIEHCELLGIGVYFAGLLIGGEFFGYKGIIVGIAIGVYIIDLYLEYQVRKLEEQDNLRKYVDEIAKENNIQMFYTDRLKTKEDVRNLAYQIKSNLDRNDRK